MTTVAPTLPPVLRPGEGAFSDSKINSVVQEMLAQAKPGSVFVRVDWREEDGSVTAGAFVKLNDRWGVGGIFKTGKGLPKEASAILRYER